jgi:ribonuclease J
LKISSLWQGSVKPKAFVPIKGLYKDLLKAEQAAKESGVLDGHTALIDNGQILKINKDGECVISRDEIKTADAYIDGIGVGDIGSVVLNERRQLATDGVVIIGANIDNKTKELVSLVDMQMRGVIFIQDENPIFKALHVQIQNIFENGVKTFKTDPRKFDINEIRKEIISKVRTMIKKDAGKQPIVLAVINEIDGNFKPRPSRNN